MGRTAPFTVRISTPRSSSRERVVVHGDGLCRRTSADVLRIAGIQDGDVVAPGLCAAAIVACEPEAAWNRAMRLVSYRERSRAEIAQRLTDDGYPVPAIEQVLTRLADAGYLDDARFADTYVRSKRASGWGRRRIACGLGTRGVSSDIAAHILDAHVPEADEVTRARAAVARLDTTTRTGTTRALRKLVSRGFTYDAARAALRHVDCTPVLTEGAGGGALEP